MNIVIGSTAIKHWIRSFRIPNDFDLISSRKIEGKDTIILPESIIKLVPHKYEIATLDAVYTIKCSHLSYDIKWQKHKNDVLFLKSKGCNLIENLYRALIDYWKETNGNKPYLSLYKKKTDFFNDHVEYVFDHDELHKVVAEPNEPVYTLCLKENEEVYIDKEKFFKLSKEQQVRMFREEITVIAAERWLIPKRNIQYEIPTAYSLALHKTTTSLTKNWASEFIIENLDLLYRPDINLFNNLINKGYFKMAECVENWQEVINEIIAYHNAEEEWNGGSELDENDYYEFVELTSYGDFESIEQDGGGEGGTEDCYFVFKWKGVFYKLAYNYYSHHGYEFDYANLYVVTPEEKMITVYN